MERHGIVISISVPPDKQPILKRIDELALREYRRSKGARSKLTLKAWQEYLDNHYPGNPQPPLFNLSRLQDESMDKRAIIFLRIHRKLGFKRIAKIVGRSVGYVYDTCKDLKEIKPIRYGGRFPFETYRKRFEALMKGEYATPQEAFRFP